MCRRKLRHRVVCDHCWGKSNIDAELAVKKREKKSAVSFLLLPYKSFVCENE